MNVVRLFLSKHAKMRLSKRLSSINLKRVIHNPIVMYKDNFDNKKYYINMKNGFIVLSHMRGNKYIVKTITNRGIIDDRDYEIFDRVIIIDKTNS